ncbi:MAG TPA: D-alanyl-D-alanine carboxypeptidase family protein [Candidatus Binataceae bacterium]|nr:D-alanyl-D-alanine carboxypeptidase family protein [Candidatus Binataceae bacterium]
MPARRAGSFRHIAITLAVLFGAALAHPPHAIASRRHHARTAEDQTATSSAAAYVAACVIEPTTGTLIFEKNDHQPWPTASLTKMMVMLIVAEKLHDGSLKLTDQVTTSRKAAQMGGSQVYLKEGETFSLDDSMKALVVHSANDSAVAIAEYVAGSTEAFVQMMNQRAAELGMKDTHYYSVHGLPPGRGQQADVASAYDQALLARELVKYPDILRWSSIDTAPFRNGTFELRNTNHLVRTYKGCDGLKTGFYDKAGFNVVATAHRGGMRLIAVVLGTPHKLTNFKEAAELMSQGFLDYEMRTVAAKGAPVKQAVTVTGGAAASLTPVFGGDAAVFVKRSAAKNALQVVYNLPPSVAAPVSAGQQIGTANIVQDGKPVASVSLVAPAEVAKQGSALKRIFGKL